MEGGGETNSKVSKAKGAIYVSNFSSTIQASDLEELIGKMLKVLGTYMPGPTATGLKRAFAIISVEADELSAITTCARKLNDCYWKGSRIFVEMAKTFYKDRLDSERLADKEAKEMQFKKVHIALNAPLPVYDPMSKNSMLRLLRIPKHHEWVATHHTACTTVRRGYSDLTVKSLGRRITFEYNDDGSLRNQLVVDGNNASTAKYSLEKNNDLMPILAASGRKGFGTLMDSAPSRRDNIDPRKPFHLTREAQKQIDNTYHDFSLNNQEEHIEMNNWAQELGYTTAGDMRHANSEFASGQHDSDTEAQEASTASHRYIKRVGGLADDSSDDEHIPSCAPEELDPEALRRERQRAIAIFAQLLAGSLQAPTAQTEHAISDAIAEPVAEPQTLAPPAPQQRLLKRGWDAVRETAALRYDPTAADGGAKFLLNAEEKAAQLQAAREREVQKLEASRADTMNAEHANLPIPTVEVEHADLGELKGIFARDSGVWFGDDGDLGHAVQKRRIDPSADSGLDEIFLAAEKQGLDVRSVADQSSTGMTFSFFEQSEADPLVATKNVVVRDADKQAVSRPSPQDPLDMDADDGMTAHEETIEIENTDPNVFAFSLNAMCGFARSFCRVGDVEALKSAWSAQRAKGLTDIRRRVHDLRRKNKRSGMTSLSKNTQLGGLHSDFRSDEVRPTKPMNRKRGGRRGQGGRS